ncbi:MAG: FAD:protein FMN transferase [Verrucomicrobiota bacterium]|jgi:thiamine biosynthesis lipoprotein|nr:FAD:protein FMN transferase [Verrucomicrobiota bacterium]
MKPAVHRYEHQAMNTVFEVMLVEEDARVAESAAYAVFQKVDRLEEQFSRFLDVSEVAMISRLKPGETYRVAPETLDLLLIATRVCAATRGAFDVTVGTVMDALRGVGHRWGGLTEQERGDALAACGMNRLVIDVEHLLVAVKPDRQGRDTPLELDFGALGKGYAVDAGCALLGEDYGFTDFLIHGGTSSVAARGSMGDGPPGWPVGVGGDWKKRAGLDAARLDGGGALSGSGFEVKGAHIVDVRRGVAAAQHAAAWSYAPTAAVADALSTAFLGMGWGEIVAACAELEGCGALVARAQPEWMDKFRRPVRQCGRFPNVHSQ